MAINRSKIGEAFVSVSVDDNPFKRGLKRVGRNLTTFGSRVSATGGAMIGGGAALAAPLVGAFTAGMKFRRTMSEVQAVSGASGEALDSLASKAKELGSTTSFSAAQVAEAMKFLAMAGFDDQQILSSIDSVLNLAKAGGLELGRAADIASDVGSAFGLGAGDFGRVADVIAKTATSANTTVEMMGETFAKAAPAAKAAGQSIEEVSAAAGLLGNSGIKASVAGTDLQNILATLADGAKREEIEKYAGSILDASGEMLPMLDILRAMNDGMSAMTGPQRLAAMMDIFGRQSADSAIVLATAGSQIDAMREKMDNAAGSAAAMAEIMGDNTTGSFANVVSAIESVSIAVHDALDPAFRVVSDILAGAFRSIASYIDKNRELVTTLAGVSASLIGVGASLKVVGIAMKAVGLAALGPWGWIAAAIAGVGIAIAGANGSLNSMLKAFGKGFADVFAGLKAAFDAGQWTLVAEIAIEALKVGFIKGLESLKAIIVGAGKGIADAIKSIFSGDFKGAMMALYAKGAFSIGDPEAKLKKLLDQAAKFKPAEMPEVAESPDGTPTPADTPTPAPGQTMTPEAIPEATAAAIAAQPELTTGFGGFSTMLQGISPPEFKTLGSFDAQFGGANDPTLGLLQQISETNQRMLDIEQNRDPITYGSGA